MSCPSTDGALRPAPSVWRGARRPFARPPRREPALTTPDLVLLSLLAERPMHGYQANLELERRQVRDWAGISRPQVYYSLEKLARRHLLRAASDRSPAAGPQRRVFQTTARGRRELARALARKAWTGARERPPFITWLALSWQAAPAVVRRQVRRRAQFVRAELARERSTLAAVLREVGHPYHEAVWSVSLMVAHLETELGWLARLSRELPRRAPARHPDYAEPSL
ncbi:MAG TPA: PadR family transcriptional regulator [Candidatus Binatia bacterium]|nr:PadR family transcriptional regulator [Candidatus Binatia bacterium]